MCVIGVRVKLCMKYRNYLISRIADAQSYRVVNIVIILRTIIVECEKERNLDESTVVRHRIIQMTFVLFTLRLIFNTSDDHRQLLI